MKNKELMNEIKKNAGDFSMWIINNTTRCDDLVFKYDFITNEIEIVVIYEVKCACYVDFIVKISSDNIEVGIKIRTDNFEIIDEREENEYDYSDIEKLKEVIASADLMVEFYEKRLYVDSVSGKIIYRNMLK